MIDESPEDQFHTAMNKAHSHLKWEIIKKDK